MFLWHDEIETRIGKRWVWKKELEGENMSKALKKFGYKMK